MRILVYSIAAALLGLGLVPAVFGQTDASRLDAVDRFIEQAMRENHVPGLAIAVVQAGAPTYLKGFGRADNQGRSVTPETPFLIASITKTYTAALVLQLVEEGRIGLDDPVRKHVDWFQIADPGQSGNITVRHLLTHTSGLPSITPGEYERVFADPHPDDLVNEVRRLQGVGLQSAPGERFQYSNAGFVTLALLIETLTGRPYEEALQARLFSPLRMEHAHVSPEEAKKDGLAQGHRHWFGHPVPFDWSHSRTGMGAGFTYASAADLATFLDLLLRGGTIHGTRLLETSSVEELFRPQVERPGPGDGTFGLGWFTGSLHGERMASHEGVAPNYYGQILLLPERGIGVVVLMNGSSGLLSNEFDAVGAGVASILLGHEPLRSSTGNFWITILWMLLVGDALLMVAPVLPRILSRNRSAFRTARKTGWVLFALIGMAWALACVHVLPSLLSWPIRWIMFAMPDVGTVLYASTAVGIAVAAFAATRLFQRARRKAAGSGQARENKNLHDGC